MTVQIDEDDPFDTFQFALKAEESKRQYPRRLKIFLLITFLVAVLKMSFFALRQVVDSVHSLVCYYHDNH